MESLQDLLGKYSQKEPAEIAIIKQYIQDQFQSPCGVALKGEAIIITVRSASLANTLRFHGIKLQAACQTTKRLIFRIG